MSDKKPSIAILGMSPGNSYFKENAIQGLIDQVKLKFNGFRVMIPDHPAQYTYRARGEKHPERKSRLQGNAIRNRIKKIIGNEDQEKFTLNWKENINKHPAYKKSIKEILVLYRENENFKEAISSATREVLSGVNGKVTDSQVEIGVKFLLCELAFLAVAKEILDSDVTYVYHRSWPIFSDFIAGKFDGKVRDIDFEVID